MIVDCAHYHEGRRQHEGPMELEHAAGLCISERDGFVWLGLFEPTHEELADIQARFGLHDLAVEDAESFHLRPKFEQFDDGSVYFVVLRTARYVEETEEIDFGEVAVFMSTRFVITVRQGAASDLHAARTRLERRPELLAEGPASVLWAIVDKVVDDYAPVVQGLEGDIEEVEATVFSGSAAPNERIYFLRREATDFYRAVHPLLGPLDAIERGAFPRIGTTLRPYFRDVNDHLKLVEEEIVAHRELLAVMLQANMAVMSVEQNETAKRLTIIATIFLPLTFITGFFGMNFAWMTGKITSLWVFLVFGIGSLVLSCAALYVWFRRRQFV
jgi:magnesium transporter